MSDAIVDLPVSENNLHVFCIHDFYVNEVAQNFFYLPVRKHLLLLQRSVNAKGRAPQSERRTATEDALAKEETCSAAVTANVEQGINLAETEYVYSQKLLEAVSRLN